MFWDASALVPLFVAEPTSLSVKTLFAEPEPVAVWWGTRLECVSAVYRRGYHGQLDAVRVASALQGIEEAFGEFVILLPTDAVASEAVRLLALYPLRAADAMQLASWSLLFRNAPAAIPFVSGDARLLAAATAEGAPTIRP